MLSQCFEFPCWLSVFPMARGDWVCLVHTVGASLTQAGREGCELQ